MGKQFESVSSKYGAPMGRATYGKPEEALTKIRLFRVTLDQGYDDGGAYWGQPTGLKDLLYCACSKSDDYRAFVRAASRDAARRALGLDQNMLCRRTPEGPVKATESAVDFDPFFSAYLFCALWSSTDSDGFPLYDGYGVEDFAEPTHAAFKEDCRDFFDSNKEELDAAMRTLGYSRGSAGRDFWLTRNRHGSGFWDRGLGDIGARLTSAAKVHSCIDLYVGADGKIYS